MMNNIFIIFAPILYFIALLIPVIVPGPLASMLLVWYAKKKQLSMIHLLLLLIADGLSLFVIIFTRGYDLACLTFPVAAFVSWRILFASRTIRQIEKEDAEMQKRIDVGVISILFLQILIFVIATAMNTE